MFEKIEDYYLSEPKRLISLGQTILSATMALAIAGVYGYLVTTIPSLVRVGTKVPLPSLALADVLTGVPTWWIPETLLGFTLTGALAIAGVVAVRTGRLYERYMK